MLDSTTESIVERLSARLLRARRVDGGWPYYEGKQARVEPTCWALLALGDRRVTPAFSFEPQLAYLASRQQKSGLLVDADGAPANLVANGLAACTLQVQAFGDRPMLAPLVAAIASVKGAAIPQGPSPQNNALRAWPWVDGTFSWVEPTAWCVLALKKRRARQPVPGVDTRISEAESMLIDRACRGGGWNYGNAAMFEQDLRPYVPTTALGLIALQDRARTATVHEGATTLERLWKQERSTFALSLAILALERLGRDSRDAQIALAEHVGRAEQNGDVLGVAMAACALSMSALVQEALGV